MAKRPSNARIFIDYRNKKLYNIILNTDGLSVKQTAKKLLEKIKFS